MFRARKYLNLACFACSARVLARTHSFRTDACTHRSLLPLRSPPPPVLRHPEERVGNGGGGGGGGGSDGGGHINNYPWQRGDGKTRRGTSGVDEARGSRRAGGRGARRVKLEAGWWEEEEEA